MDWQPIETAPRDGTDILLLFPSDGAIQGSWHVIKSFDGVVYEQLWSVITLDSHGCGCCSSDNEDPTHWISLPAPPEAK